MANKPKLELETNIPATVVLDKKFWEGSNQYGPSFGWGVKHDGVEKTAFVSEYLHDQLSQFKKGDTVTICKRQRAGEKSVTWEVSATNGHVSAPATTARKVVYDAPVFNRAEFRQNRVQRLREAVEDVQSAIEGLGTFNAEDIRAMAISCVIEEYRQGVPVGESATETKDAPEVNDNEELLTILKTQLAELSEVEPDTSKREHLEHWLGTRTWADVEKMPAEALKEVSDKLAEHLVPF